MPERDTKFGALCFKHRGLLMWTFTALVMASPINRKVSRRKRALGLSLTLLGFALRGWSTGYAGIATRTTKADNPPEKLITEGPFTHSRNPIYLGNQIMFAGILIMIGHGFKTLFFSIPAFLFYSLIVRYEEDLLEERFKARYWRYKCDTPRWIPGRMQISTTSALDKFSLRMALGTERYTVYNCVRLYMMRKASIAVRRRIGR